MDLASDETNECHNRTVTEWERLDIRGASGPIGNTFLRQHGSRLGIVLPGFLGGWMTAPVYYAVLALLDKDFDVLCLDSIYRDHPDALHLRDDAAAAVRAGQTAGDYVETTLVGKSLGTLAMAELLLAGFVAPTTPSIWLTPLLNDIRVKAAIDRLETGGLFVIGTDDPHFDPGVLDELRLSGHETLILEKAHHGLAIEGSAVGSAEIPSRIVQAVIGYAPDSLVRDRRT